jgi:hypothetical protein
MAVVVLTVVVVGAILIGVLLWPLGRLVGPVFRQGRAKAEKSHPGALCATFGNGD